MSYKLAQKEGIMKTFEVTQIGTIQNTKDGTFIKLDAKYAPALTSLDGFSHVNILWWFSGFDHANYRSMLEMKQPYKNAPEHMGIFATRSPIRPNPIALTAVEVLDIDHENGVLQVAYIDADDDTPVLDIKPYTPSIDRIESPSVPDWCKHWPKSMEESMTFDWGKEFNF